MSLSRRAPNPTPETGEKRSHRADLSSRKVAKEPSIQSNEEEDTEFALVHRKWKVSVHAGLQVGVALY